MSNVNDTNHITVNKCIRIPASLLFQDTCEERDHYLKERLLNDIIMAVQVKNVKAHSVIDDDILIQVEGEILLGEILSDVNAAESEEPEPEPSEPAESTNDVPINEVEETTADEPENVTRDVPQEKPESSHKSDSQLIITALTDTDGHPLHTSSNPDEQLIAACRRYNADLNLQGRRGCFVGRLYRSETDIQEGLFFYYYAVCDITKEQAEKSGLEREIRSLNSQMAMPWFCGMYNDKSDRPIFLHMSDILGVRTGTPLLAFYHTDPSGCEHAENIISPGGALAFFDRYDVPAKD